ncbi:MAG: uroporphyrinogen decarboxylase/cobalamine-independent methonine synthase family protein [Bacillota bacterium]
MLSFEPMARPTGIGSLPFADPDEACRFVQERLPDIPFWPQLPRRGPRENMYLQFSPGLPGLVEEGPDLVFDRPPDYDDRLAHLYQRYLDGDADWPLDRDHAAGFYAMTERHAAGLRRALAIKGQVTGPVSYGLTVTGRDKRLLLYDEVAFDAVVKGLALQARWQEGALRRFNPTTIIFLDEPSMAAFGSAYYNLDRGRVIGAIREVTAGLTGLTGVHCCGNTDWPVLIDAGLDVLSFDAYYYARNLSLYPEAVAAFLARGGVLAWGIVPTDTSDAVKEDVPSLVARLEEALGWFAEKGLDKGLVLRQSLITPSCGLGSWPEATARHVFDLVRGVSAEIRRRYGLDH